MPVHPLLPRSFGTLTRSHSSRLVLGLDISHCLSVGLHLKEAINADALLPSNHVLAGASQTLAGPVCRSLGRARTPTTAPTTRTSPPTTGPLAGARAEIHYVLRLDSRDYV